MSLVNIGLFAILLIVLSAPFMIKLVEKELEVFLFIMGCLAVTVTSQWSAPLMHEALIEPIKITLAVLVAGIIFKYAQATIKRHIAGAEKVLGQGLLIFLIIVLLGILSSVITAIIAALVLVEVVLCLSVSRKNEIKIVICACFAIGLGAAMTPIGEPLSTIVIAKLRGEPYHAGFFFLFTKFAWYIIPGVIASAIAGVILTRSKKAADHRKDVEKAESMKVVTVRAAKIYLFVMALVFLGTGFKPIIDQYISVIPYQVLYWINMVSAILDNATLAAAEIGPSMQMVQIKSALLGLLISGGMLIPGNIPNIISAGKLKITSSEWAKLGVPMGLVLMAIYFVVILIQG